MPGAEVPAAGVIGADGNQNATQETLYENLAEAVRRVIGIGLPSPSPEVISVGTITPEHGFLKIDTEGAFFLDNLDTISPDNYLENSILVITAVDPGRIVSVQHLAGGAGQINLSDGIALNLTPSIHVLLRLEGTTWIEIGRFFGSNAAAARAYLGLGTAAVLDDGSLDAATLEGSPAAAFLPAGATAVDSLALGGEAAANYLRNNLAALQILAGALRVGSGRLDVESALATSSTVINLRVAGLTRTILAFEPVSEVLTLLVVDAAGVNSIAGLRFVEGAPPQHWDSVADAWTDFLDIDRDLVPLFPTIGRFRWDMPAPSASLGVGDHVLVSVPVATLLPGTGSDPIYRITTELVEESSTGPPFGKARIHLGPVGDETDPIVAEETFGGVGGIAADAKRVWTISPTVSPGDLWSFVVRIDSGSFRPEASLVSGGATLQRTFLEIEQIG